MRLVRRNLSRPRNACGRRGDRALARTPATYRARPPAPPRSGQHRLTRTATPPPTRRHAASAAAPCARCASYPGLRVGPAAQRAERPRRIFLFSSTAHLTTLLGSRPW